jgi:hypothetical protein
MLSEVIRSEELFGRVALPEFVHLLQVLDTLIPVLVRGVLWRITTVQSTRTRSAARPKKFETTVAAGVSFARSVGRIVEGPIVSGESRACPRMAAYVKRVLMAFCLVLILEAVATV